jgi:deoxycytidine triphosphate deaminase
MYDEKDEASFVIKPGETAFVETEEDLELPNDIFCQLSTKRKLSHDGILLLGGFCIDPNYKGKLFFGLHNFTREDYPFRPTKKLVAGIFYKLDENEAKAITSTPEPMYEFPDELIKNVKFFRSASTESLETKIEE